CSLKLISTDMQYRHKTTGMIAGLLVAGIASLGLCASAAASGFEGNWSVVVRTESGTCDVAYRYPVRVENGNVIYQGDASIVLSGRVAVNGAVKVSISRGSQRAEGIGRLSATAGAGTWTGASTSGECHGRWEAERPPK